MGDGLIVNVASCVNTKFSVTCVKNPKRKFTFRLLNQIYVLLSNINNCELTY